MAYVVMALYSYGLHSYGWQVWEWEGDDDDY